MPAKLTISWDLIEKTLELPRSDLYYAEVDQQGNLVVALTGHNIDEVVGEVLPNEALPDIIAVCTKECRFQRV